MYFLLYSLYFRAESGKRIFSPYPTRRDRYSVLAALGIGGMIGWTITEGTYNSEAFISGLSTFLCPYLRLHRDMRLIVVMDGAAIHKNVQVRELLAECGAACVYLPPYSPEYNPIEKVFSLVKM